MSSFLLTDREKAKFQKIAERGVTQSPHHQANITEMFRIIYQEAKREFFEDNKVTLDTFLQECFDNAKA